MKFKFLCVCASILFLSMNGCATLVKGGSSEILIETTPSSKQIEIIEVNSDLKIFSGNTPAIVNLSRSFSYGDGNKYNIILREYEGDSVPIIINLSADKKNGWYTVGNLFSTLFIGWFFVDSVTGAMYSWSDVDIDNNFSNISIKYKVKNRRHNKIEVIYKDEK